MPTNAWVPVGGAANGDDPANWSLSHFPLSSEDVSIGGSDIITFTAEAAIPCSNFNASGFSGTIAHSGDFTIQLYGTSCQLSATMTVPDFFVLAAMPGATVALDTNGLVPAAGKIIDISGQGGDWTFTESTAAIQKIQLATAGSDLNWGTTEVTIELATGQECGIDGIDAGSVISYSAGAKLIVKGGDDSYCDINMDDGPVIPPVEVTEGCIIYSTTGMKMASYYQAATAIKGTWLADMGGDWTTLGDFTVLGGKLSGDSSNEDISGRTFNVGGAFECVVNLNSDGAGTATFNVTGLADATGGASQTIKNCDFSGGSKLYAPGCLDGLGNSNVIFAERPSVSSATIGSGAGF